VAQETGLQCACAFVEFGGRPAATAAKVAFTSALVEKNILGSARAGSKKAAVELCLLLVECEGNAETVFEACMEGLKSKQPKAVAGAVFVIKEVVR
jgi:cytoskeleton-associated protein 5